MNVIVIYNQSLIDLSIQLFGTPDFAMLLAIENGLSITSDLQSGTVLTVPDVAPTNPEYQQYFKNKLLKPATAIKEGDELVYPQGISYWIINKDFKVS